MPSGPNSNDRPTSSSDAIEIDLPTPSASAGDDVPVVVVVDDDADIRTMLVRALGTKYTVYEARDGLEARELLQLIPAPDAIVCDVMMPRLDGLGLVKLLRKDSTLQRVPVLFLTARGSATDVISGINAGARHYVTKPFKIAEVLAKIATMTGANKK
ncbi:MAG: response regulator [Polyangiaceae bacterium]|jgi:DNA-binding response OmpR family regulator